MCYPIAPQQLASIALVIAIPYSIDPETLQSPIMNVKYLQHAGYFIFVTQPQVITAMIEQHIIEKTRQYAQETLAVDCTGHDWLHVSRVWNMAKYIAAHEKTTDLLVIELSALLHDIADWKFHGGDENKGVMVAREWLTPLNVAQPVIEHVCMIINDISFKGAGHVKPMQTLEGQIVQDADRLDAMGAIGIARTFAYGGYKHRPIYDPNITPILHKNAAEYKRATGTTINHFYEKLLLLKDLINTETAKKIAEKRHARMQQFIDEFLQECNGEV